MTPYYYTIEGVAANLPPSSSPLVVIAGAETNSTFFVLEEAALKSLFFRAAFDRKWKEGKSRTLKLPEDEPRAVAAYLEWLYTSNVPSKSIGEMSTSEREQQWEALALLYVFAEKVTDHKCCNEVLTSLTIMCDERTPPYGARKFPSATSLRIIWEGTAQDALIREFLVEVYGQVSMLHFNKEGADEYPPEFLYELCKSLLQKRKQVYTVGFFGRRMNWFKKTATSKKKAFDEEMEGEDIMEED